MRKKKRLYLLAGLMVFVTCFLAMGTQGIAKYKARLTAELPTLQVIPKRYDIGDAEVTEIPAEVFTGSEIRPPLTVTHDGRTLTEGVDFTVSYSENVHAGTATVVLTGINGFEGAKTVTFDILKRKVAPPVLSETRYTYDGAVHTVTASGGDADWFSESGTASASAAGDYSVTWSLAYPDDTEWTDGGNDPVTADWRITVCHIGEIYYTSVQNAFDVGSTEETPVVLDVDWTESPVNRRDNVFDGNGHTLTGSGTCLTNAAGTLRYYGGTLIGKSSRSNARGVRVTGGTAILSGGRIEAICRADGQSGKEAHGVSVSGGLAVIDGAEVVGTGNACHGAAVYLAGANGAAEIRSGTLTATTNAGNHTAAVIYQEGGTLTLSGGSGSAEAPNYSAFVIHSEGGTAAVTGGTYSCAGGTAANNVYALSSAGGTITASGGTFTADGRGVAVTAGSAATAGKITLSGSVSLTAKNGPEVFGIMRTDMTGGSVRAQNGSAMTIGALESRVLGGTFKVTGGGGTARAAYTCREAEYPGGCVMGGTFTVRNDTGTAEGFVECTVGGSASVTIERGASAGSSDEADGDEGPDGDAGPDTGDGGEGDGNEAGPDAGEGTGAGEGGNAGEGGEDTTGGEGGEAGIGDGNGTESDSGASAGEDEGSEGDPAVGSGTDTGDGTGADEGGSGDGNENGPETGDEPETEDPDGGSEAGPGADTNTQDPADPGEGETADPGEGKTGETADGGEEDASSKEGNAPNSPTP